MICVVEGAVGAGKTYWVVDQLARHLRNGGIVATNLVLHLDPLRRLTGRRLSGGQLLTVSAESSPFDIPRGDFRGHGSRRVLVVLDEALNWFPSGRTTEGNASAWPVWLRQSDKLGQDVYFIAQRFDRAAKWLRELAQLCVSIKNFGQIRFLGVAWGRYLGLSKLSGWCRYDLGIQQRTGWGLYILNSLVWDCYETSTLYGFPASSNAYDAFRGLWPKHRSSRVPYILAGLFAAFSLSRLVAACFSDGVPVPNIRNAAWNASARGREGAARGGRTAGPQGGAGGTPVGRIAPRSEALAKRGRGM